MLWAGVQTCDADDLVQVDAPGVGGDGRQQHIPTQLPLTVRRAVTAERAVRVVAGRSVLTRVLQTFINVMFAVVT